MDSLSRRPPTHPYHRPENRYRAGPLYSLGLLQLYITRSTTEFVTAPPMALQLVLSMAALFATPASGEAGPTVTSRMTIFPGVRPPV
jgi:hypothetical protein